MNVVHFTLPIRRKNSVILLCRKVAFNILRKYLRFMLLLFLLWNCINRVSKWSTFFSNILEGASDKTIFCLWIHCPRLMSSVGRCFGGLFETFSHYLQYLLTEHANRRAVWFSLFSAGWLHWSNVCEGDWVGYKSVLPLWRRTRVCLNWPIICTSCS